MKRMASRLVAGVAAGVAVFVGFSIWVGVTKVRTGDSLQVFLAGFALTVTPGKLGEAVKAVLLRASHRIPMAKTAPIVIAERVTDLVALLLLALVVVSVDPVAKAAIAIAGKLPILRRFAHRLDDAHAHTAILLAPLSLIVTTLLSTVSWFFACLAFLIVVRGFPGTDISVQGATFVYAAMTVAGALSFLPGGLGATEAGMLALLTGKTFHIAKGTAMAATFVTRLATLWFAVALGLPALLVYARRKHVQIDADVARPEPADGLP